MRSNSIRYIGSAIFVWLLFFVVSPSFAQTKAQLEKQKAQLEVEIKRLNNELSAAKKNTRLTTAQLTALNKKISERTKLINNINSQMSILDQQIGQTNDSIVIMRRKVDSLKTEYAKVKSIRIRRSRHTIYVNEMFNKNQVYAEPADLDFVAGYISARIPSGAAGK